MISTLAHLAHKSAYIVRHYSWRTFYTKARQKLFPIKVHQRVRNKTYASEALTLAERFDFTPAELERSRAVMAAHQGALPIRTINWHLPHFEHAHYGGMHTILRFAAGFALRHNVRNTFVVLGNAGAPEAGVYAERICTIFPALSECTVLVKRAAADLATAPAADACVATFWTTAYDVLKFNQTKRKFYLIQDFEPAFYPAGSISAQAEATYRFGLYGLANTVALQHIYSGSYGGCATSFHPSVDGDLFYPPPDSDREPGQPATVFFYARPDFCRNGFELGVIALRKLKRQLGQRVRIVSAGQQWNPADYGLASVVENRGLLSYQETASLYRTCDVGLVLMFTQHPSYLPFELMASGCLVVSNVNNATAWLLKDDENCLLTLPSASYVADVLARGLQDHALRRRITRRALELIRQEFVDWDQQIDHVYRYMCDPEATV